MYSCIHILTYYTDSSYNYFDFIDTQLDDFILEHKKCSIILFISSYGIGK